MAVLAGGIALATTLLTPFSFVVTQTGPLLPAAPFFVASGLIHVLYLTLVGAIPRVSSGMRNGRCHYGSACWTFVG